MQNGNELKVFILLTVKFSLYMVPHGKNKARKKYHSI